MNTETFYVKLQDVFVDGCKMRMHTFSQAPGIFTVKMESWNQTAHTRRQSSAFSSGQTSVFASDVWPSCINGSFVQEMCGSLCVAGRCSTSASGVTCGTVGPPELSAKGQSAYEQAEQLSNCSSSSCLQPCTASISWGQVSEGVR